MFRSAFGIGVLTLVTTALVGGCGRTPVSPAPIRPGSSAAPVPPYTVTVTVGARNLFPHLGTHVLAGAHVQVVGGVGHQRSLGAFCITDADGRCTFPEPFTVQTTPELRVSKEGFITLTVPAKGATGSSVLLNVTLTQTGLTQFAGTYVLSLVASNSCATLPPSLQTVTVNATIGQEGESIWIITEGTDPSCPSFHGGTAGGDSMGAYSDPECGGVLRITGPDAAIVAQGVLRATRTGSTLSGTFNGELAEGKPFGWSFQPVGGCRAVDHALTLTPR